MLKINLETLPEHGADIAGALEDDLLQLPEHDGKPAGPLEYDLHVQRFEDELLLTGYLCAPLQLVCTGCLTEYQYDIELQNAAIAIEIETGGELDVSEAVREELLVHFPAHPRCTDSEGFDHCDIDPRYLAVDKPTGDAVDPAPAPAADSKWAALDALQTDSSGPASPDS